MSCGTTEAFELVIGDDYLGVHSRGITVDFCAIPEFTIGSVEAKMGFDDSEGHTLIVTGGTVTDNEDGTWKAQIDITKVQSATLTPGIYDWSVEVTEGGYEYTVAKSINSRTKIRWVAKQT